MEEAKINFIKHNVEEHLAAIKGILSPYLNIWDSDFESIRLLMKQLEDN